MKSAALCILVAGLAIGGLRGQQSSAVGPGGSSAPPAAAKNSAPAPADTSKKADAKKDDVPQLTGDEKATIFEFQRNALALGNRMQAMQIDFQALQAQSDAVNKKGSDAFAAARNRIIALCPTCVVDPNSLGVTNPPPPAPTAAPAPAPAQPGPKKW